jgi:hypothetical protein
MSKRFQDFLQSPYKRYYPVEILTPDYFIKGNSKWIRWYRVPLLNETGVYYTAQIIKEKIDHHKNAPVIVTGDPGVGKSTLISKIARKIDPAFDVDKVGFTLEEFNEIFASLPQGNGAAGVYSQADMDESAYAAFTDDRLKSEQTELAKNLIISRIEQKIVYFGAPKAKQINSRVRDLGTIWIDVSEPDYDLQGYAEVHLPPPKKQSKYGAGKYWEPNYAFTFKKETGEFWNKYEAKKIAFVRNALTGNNKHSSKSPTIEEIEYLMKEGWKDEKIAEMHHVDRTRIVQIRSAAKAAKA